MSEQRTLSIQSRAFDPTDYERMVEIGNANFPEYPVSVAEQRSRDEAIQSSKIFHRRLTFSDREGTVVGFGTMSQVIDMLHPQKFMINIIVDPKFQGRGIGTTIYDSLSKQLEEMRAIVVWTMNKEDLPLQTRFFAKRGFVGKSRSWESRLDLATFDTSRFQEYLSRALIDGIEFSTLAEEPKTETFLHQLHEFVQLINEDMPRDAPFTALSYEQWRAFSFENPKLIHGGYWIARKDEELVGISNVVRNEKDPKGLSQDDTGVKRVYRHRGIATALKVKVIDWAKRSGYQSIKTWNDSNNVPMLAVNTRLGFKRQVGWVLMQKDIG